MGGEYADPITILPVEVVKLAKTEFSSLYVSMISMSLRVTIIADVLLLDWKEIHPFGIVQIELS